MTRTLRLFLPILLAVLCLTRPAHAQSADDVFNPQYLPRGDVRYVQTGLALQGLYVGLIDGEWGKGSQSALERYMAGRYSGALRYRDLLPLLQQTQGAIQADFWQGVNDFSDRATFLAPMAILQQDYQSELFTLQSPDGSLKVRLIDNDKDKTIEMHQWLLDNHKGTKAELYQNYEDKWLITSGKLKSGKTVYLRSQYARSGVIVTVLVQYEPWHKERGALIAASISFDGPTELALDNYSPLGQLMRGAATPAKPSRPVSGGSGGGISRPAPGTGAQPNPGGGISGGGIARPAPGTGISGGGGSGGISRPAVPVAPNAFVIPPVPVPE